MKKGSERGWLNFTEFRRGMKNKIIDEKGEKNG
jgi:hypothetical protein